MSEKQIPNLNPSQMFEEAFEVILDFAKEEYERHHWFSVVFHNECIELSEDLKYHYYRWWREFGEIAEQVIEENEEEVVSEICPETPVAAATEEYTYFYGGGDFDIVEKLHILVKPEVYNEFLRFVANKLGATEATENAVYKKLEEIVKKMSRDELVEELRELGIPKEDIENIVDRYSFYDWEYRGECVTLTVADRDTTASEFYADFEVLYGSISKKLLRHDEDDFGYADDYEVCTETPVSIVYYRYWHHMKDSKDVNIKRIVILTKN